MKIVWDEPKREANFKTHRLDLADAKTFGWDRAIIGPSHSGRFKAVGYLGTMLVAVVFKPLGTEGFSIISLRRASKSERRLHGTR